MIAIYSQARQRRRTGAFGEIMRVLVIRADRSRDLMVGNFDDRLCPRVNYRNGIRVGYQHGNPVCER